MSQIYYPLSNYDMRIIVNDLKFVKKISFHNNVNLKTPPEPSGMWLGGCMLVFSYFSEKLPKTTQHLGLGYLTPTHSLVPRFDKSTHMGTRILRFIKECI